MNITLGNVWEFMQPRIITISVLMCRVTSVYKNPKLLMNIAIKREASTSKHSFH
jgi:hypothetical protein